MTERDLRKLLKHIEDSEQIDTLSEIARMMKDIVIKDKRMSVENKMRFLFLYYQHRYETNKKAGLLLHSADKRTISFIDRILASLFPK